MIMAVAGWVADTWQRQLVHIHWQWQVDETNGKSLRYINPVSGKVFVRWP